MSKRPKPAQVSYYVDADLLGLAKVLVQVRGDVTYPGDPGGKVKGGRVREPCPITDPATLDEVAPRVGLAFAEGAVHLFGGQDDTQGNTVVMTGNWVPQH